MLIEPSVPVVAVVGRPNVGKSTLVNRILGSRQAVVEDVPGVTRDRITYDALWRGRAFTLVDTGGWEPSVEGTQSLAARVAEQAKIAVGAADAVLFVVDATVGVTDADAAVAAVLRRSGKPVVLAANKVDDTRAEPEVAGLWSLGLGEPARSARCTAGAAATCSTSSWRRCRTRPRRPMTQSRARAGWLSSVARTSASPAC